jgi:hypothetical protein
MLGHRDTWTGADADTRDEADVGGPGRVQADTLGRAVTEALPADTRGDGAETAPRSGRRPRSDSLLSRITWPRLAWRWEVLTILLGDAVYEVTSALAPQHASAAFHNAGLLISMEPPGVQGFELWLGHQINGHHLLFMITNYYYALLHLTVTAGVLIWLWWRRPAGYPRARTILFILTFGALIVFWVFPVAPPRLAVPGAVDTLAARLGGTQAAAPTGVGRGLIDLENPYAAFPSLHVAWAAWCAWAVWAHLGTRGRWFAWLYPLATTLVVIGTFNHYVLDVLAGLATLALVVAL